MSASAQAERKTAARDATGDRTEKSRNRQARRLRPTVGMGTYTPGRGGNSGSRATAIMRAMSNRQRLEILSHLMNGEERSVGELESSLKTISQSSLSQHLGRLREEDIVKTRRQSQTIFYSLSDNGVRQVIRLLSNIYTDDPALPNKIRKA